MNSKSYKNNKELKIFVTGIYGSGKTYFAKEYAKKKHIEFISFDKIHDYKKVSRFQAKKILKALPSNFIIDAIPISDRKSSHFWDDFLIYEKKNQLQIIYIYCSNTSLWIQRWHMRPRLSIKDKFNYFYKKKFKSKDFNKEIDNFRKDYAEFFVATIPLLKKFNHVIYYDSFKREFTSQTEMKKRISFNLLKLRNHLDLQKYDKYYQDIEIIDFIGYSESYKTWRRIKNIVSWRGKTVTDLGCFHGYFSFKIEDRGGSVIGLDKHKFVLETTRMINHLSHHHVVFKQWVGGQTIPKCDIILCLNVLHHFQNLDKALKKMKAKEVIFEVNIGDRGRIEKYFHILKQLPSHRYQRVILLATPKNYLKP